MWKPARPGKTFGGTRSLQRSAPVFLALLVFTNVLADTDFSGLAGGRSLFEVQRKVDTLFEEGSYERALIIYRSELAPIGDKYAQYMVGYMHLAGKGVEKDIVAAAAWFQLAAERREEVFARERDKVYAKLSPAQRARADALFVELREELGDIPLTLGLVEGELLALQRMLDDPSVARIAHDSGTGEANDVSQARLESRILARLNYLKATLLSDPYATPSELDRVQELERRGERLVRRSRRSR